MFADQRSKRVIFVAHCILNQNAKIDRCAHYPGAIRELASYLIGSDLGIVQLPCPELLALGLDRQADPGLPSTVESEDTRVASRMSEEDAAGVCRRIANDVVQQIQEYVRNGFEAAGVLGINGSPTCGVETNWRDGDEAPGPGVFVSCLQERLRLAGISIQFRGIKARESQQAVMAAGEFAKTHSR